MKFYDQTRCIAVTETQHTVRWLGTKKRILIPDLGEGFGAKKKWGIQIDGNICSTRWAYELTDYTLWSEGLTSLFAEMG